VDFNSLDRFRIFRAVFAGLAQSGQGGHDRQRVLDETHVSPLPDRRPVPLVSTGDTILWVLQQRYLLY
jgi:hypothetical protein